MKDAKNKPAAKRFVDFLLSKDGQQLGLEQGILPRVVTRPSQPVFLSVTDPFDAISNAARR